MTKYLLTLVVGVFLFNAANAHPGRTNASGCHNDRRNGTYHCHNSGTAAPRAPVSQQAAPSRPTQTQQAGVYYRNCTEARAAGVTPIRRGQPGYASHLDRDNDGIACE